MMTMAMITINVARDFTRYPSGRYKKNGNTSGEGFREKFLEPNVSKGETLVIELDGTIGYGSSFLEEAFGGVIRSLKIAPDDFLGKLKLVSDDPSLTSEIIQYIKDAGKAIG
jgi:hypothetical protein